MVAETGPEDGTAAPRLNAKVPHSARIWNYWLGGEDNISQAASRCPDSGRTVIIQARHKHFSNIGAIAVRILSCTRMEANAQFVRPGFLTSA
jgi:hypothetical protein